MPDTLVASMSPGHSLAGCVLGLMIHSELLHAVAVVVVAVGVVVIGVNEAAQLMFATTLLSSRSVLLRSSRRSAVLRLPMSTSSVHSHTPFTTSWGALGSKQVDDASELRLRRGNISCAEE